MQMLSDKEIHSYALSSSMISPFVPHTVRNDNISYGLGEGCYDVRMQTKFKVLDRKFTGFLDPRNFDPSSFVDHEATEFILEPHGFILGLTLEEFIFPLNIRAKVSTKSTYARCGIMIHDTSINPGQTGRIVLEISNVSTVPVKIYLGENHGIATLEFYQIAECESAYSGVYQNQSKILFAGNTEKINKMSKTIKTTKSTQKVNKNLKPGKTI